MTKDASKITKADAVLSWIPDGLVRVYFDATRFDVTVPKHLRRKTNVILEFAYDLPRPITDLKIDQEAISGTLSFGGHGWHFCKLPWAAVFCITAPSLNKVGVWLNDAPADVQRRVLEVAGEEANKKLRPKLRLVK